MNKPPGVLAVFGAASVHSVCPIAGQPSVRPEIIRSIGSVTVTSAAATSWSAPLATVTTAPSAMESPVISPCASAEIDTNRWRIAGAVIVVGRVAAGIKPESKANLGVGRGSHAEHQKADRCCDECFFHDESVNS